MKKCLKIFLFVFLLFISHKSLAMKLTNLDSTFGETVLTSAIRNNDFETARLLIEKGGVDINLGGGSLRETPLHLAAMKGVVDIVKLLIDRGVDVNQTDSIGVTALIHAIDEGYLDIAELLIKNGADIDHANNNGDTPLILSMYSCDLDGTKFLIGY